MKRSPSQIREIRNIVIAYTVLGLMIIGCVFLVAFRF